MIIKESVCRYALHVIMYIQSAPTLHPELYTAFPWIMIQDFLMDMEDTGKVYLSGGNPNTPIISEKLQRVFRCSILTWYR